VPFPFSSSAFLSTTALLFAMALPVAAQVSPAQPSAVPVDLLQPITPDLPLIQPALPDSVLPDSTLPDSALPDSALPDSSTVQLVLKLGERRVYLYEGEQVKASYPVAIGRVGWETPTGKFEVMQMLKQPGWTNPFTNEAVPPGAENPLGERWIGFWTDGVNSIGFHGTPDRTSVGQAASHGCVRMLNEDIRKMYELVQVGTPVTVEP
jgi:L,D-transpeptidase ErfK/SrfK